MLNLAVCYFVILKGLSLSAYGGDGFLTSLDGSRILESIGIKWSVGFKWDSLL